MKKSSREFLEEYLVSNIFDKHNVKNIFDVFKTYSIFEIDGIDDIDDAVKDFCDFWKSNLHLIVCKDDETKERLSWILDYCGMIQNLNKTMRSPEISGFVDIVKTLFFQTEGAHILDVGAGSLPASSILLGQDIKRVSSMDDKFILAEETLQKMNVHGVGQFFDEKTSVFDYDMVVGRFPCSAIIHIVSQCAKSNKPYFIELCDCNMPQSELKQAGWWGWMDILPDFDSKVQFYASYAYNLDASPDQVKSVVERFKPKKLFDSREIIQRARQNSSFISCSDFTPSGEWKRSKGEREY